MKPSFRRALMLADSNNPTERDCYLLGTLLDDGSPLLVHKKSVSEHVYMRGASGSGKSASLAYFVELLLSQGGCILHFFDLKDQNSMELFAAMRIGARRSGTKVKWFVDDVGKCTHTFNIFKQRFWRRLTPMQKAGLTGAGLGTSHGLAGYGPQFFGGAAFSLLLNIYKRYDIESWADLLDKISLVMAWPRAYGLNRKMVDAAGQLYFDVERLAEIAPFNAPSSSIDLSCNEPKAVYWSFPGSYDMAGVASRFALYSLFASMPNTEARPQTWAVCDEFQRCVGNNMSMLFQQAREKIGLILANQCLADLNTDKDYAPTLKNCCRIHWTFNAAEEAEQVFMSDVSGKTTRKQKSVSYTRDPLGIAKTTSYQEVETNRLSFNEISIASALPELSIFRCTQDYGFCQYLGFPQVIHTEFHIDADEYARRKLMPWPTAADDPEQGTIEGVMPPLLGLPTPLAPRGLDAPNIVNPGKLPRRAPRNPPPPQ